MPTIERGIPFPSFILGRIDRRKTPYSQWPAFLRSLQPGDSFVVPYPTCIHAMNIAKHMGIPLIHRVLNEPSTTYAQVRVWLAAAEPDYSI